MKWALVALGLMLAGCRQQGKVLPALRFIVTPSGCNEDAPLCTYFITDTSTGCEWLVVRSAGRISMARIPGNKWTTCWDTPGKPSKDAKVIP